MIVCCLLVALCWVVPLECQTMKSILILLLLSNTLLAEPSVATLGKQIFLDTTLSQPEGQGCVTCHSPQTAFADPQPVFPGAVVGKLGMRNAPSLIYAALIPGLASEDMLQDYGTEIFIPKGPSPRWKCKCSVRSSSETVLRLPGNGSYR